MKRTDHSPRPVAVFLGPSLPRNRACLLLDADYYPPARKGDVYRILASGVKTIILIDGVFHSTPSVWQRELLDAIDEGIEVLGASSMGALRAAELHEFGMIGHGTIFEWYRDGVIDGDDEVALWHESEDHDFRPLSEPLVNIRHTLLKAVEEHWLTVEEAQELTAHAKQVYYPKRSYQQLLNSPVVKAWSLDRVTKLEHYFSTKSVDLKMLDAIGLLRYCNDRDSRKRGKPKPRRVHHSFQRDGSWLWNYQRLMMSGFINQKGVVTGEQVLNEAYKDPVLMETMLNTLPKRCFLVEWAKQNGVCCPEDLLEPFMKQWEEEHRISDLSAWLSANGLTLSTYRRLSAERALITWMTEQGQTYFGLKRSFVLEWARQNGVALASGCVEDSVGASDEALEKWVLKQGPRYFGLGWSFDVALLHELQITGRAADLIEKMDVDDGDPC